MPNQRKYPFPEEKIKKRKLGLARALWDAARIVQADIRVRYEADAANVFPNETVIVALVEEYVSRVDAFKAKHAYPADRLIDGQKIAALHFLLVKQMNAAGSQFFRVENLGASETDHIQQSAAYWFAKMLLCLFLDMKMSSLSLQDDSELMNCFFNETAPSPEWLAFGLRGFRAAFGKARQPPLLD